ncbi:hypothetical protein DYQ86_03615 [Acidobacteria bacterium AB60]|nr:hypothetical protein DYQ86_03615 [Acidobacteria bacterium AB60]
MRARGAQRLFLTSVARLCSTSGIVMQMRRAQIVAIPAVVGRAISAIRISTHNVHAGIGA